jgi:hypothetical protein
MNDNIQDYDYEEEICLRHRIYVDDGITVVDLIFDPSIIEKGDTTPKGLTVIEIEHMIHDLATIMRKMCHD